MKTVTFKVSEAEVTFLEHQAKRCGISVSEYIRRRACRPPGFGGDLGSTIVCERTGAEIFRGADEGTLTSAMVEAMLGDFP